MNKKDKESISLKNTLGSELAQVYNRLNDHAVVFFNEFGLTPQQYNVIAILYHTGPLTTSEILNFMIEKNAGVSRLVDRLVIKKMIIKEVNSSDKRLISANLTANGRDVFEKIEKEISRLYAYELNLTEEEMLKLIELLSKINNN